MASTGTAASIESTVEDNLHSLITALGRWQVNNQSNTAIQVMITTIPPLGLPTTDPREQARGPINTWIMNNSGTSLAIDTATSVADPNNPNLIASTYLTGSTPNASYYTQVANTVAAGLANAIPPFTL
jgi:hypothetical protein